MVAVQFPEPTPPPLRPQVQSQASWDLHPGSSPTPAPHILFPIPLHSFANADAKADTNLDNVVNFRVQAYAPRNLGGAGRPSSTTTQNIVMVPSTTNSGSSSSTSEKPFFPTGSQLTPPSAGNNGNVTKTALEWLFAVSAIVVIGSLTVWRFIQLRRRNASLRAFFPRPHTLSPSSSRTHANADASSTIRRADSRRSFPRTTGLPLSDSRTSGPVPLTLPPSLFFPSSGAGANAGGGGRGRTGVRGTGVDAQGRRLDGNGDEDGVDDKDALPAYDNCHGPPKYLESQAFVVGGLVNGTTITGVAGFAGIGAGGEAYPMIDLRMSRSRSRSFSFSHSESRSPSRTRSSHTPAVTALSADTSQSVRVETRDVGVGMDPEGLEDPESRSGGLSRGSERQHQYQPHLESSESSPTPSSRDHHPSEDDDEDLDSDLGSARLSPTPTSATPLRGFPRPGSPSPAYEDTDPLARVRAGRRDSGNERDSSRIVQR